MPIRSAGFVVTPASLPCRAEIVASHSKIAQIRLTLPLHWHCLNGIWPSQSIDVYESFRELGDGAADHFSPAIAEMGAAALRLLLRVRTGEQPEARRGELVTSLVVRDSTAPLAAALHRSG
jgi:hypothetical protein